MIHVVAWGIAGSIRDAGRPGLAHLGQGRGGALDLASLALANRLVGNPEGIAAIESCGGLQLRLDRPTMVAVTGAQADLSVLSGPPLGWGVPVVLPAGAIVRIGRVNSGVRIYLAVRGGIRRIGGDTLVAGPDPGRPASTAIASPHLWPDAVHLWPGPRIDWFAPGAWHTLISSTFTVLADSNRVGVRLAGPLLERTDARELPSEGLIEGAVQVLPDGGPIIMLADHPTTGGYPVIGIVDPADVAVLAQTPIGAAIRFLPAKPVYER